MIDNEDISRLDERYVKKDDCVDNRSKTDERIDSIHEDVSVIKSEFKWLIAILSAIAVPVLGIAVKLIFGA